jgi:hypothetical protein
MTEKWKFATAALGGAVATLAAGGIAFASMRHGMGPIGNADLNHDGQITRAEWLQSANAHFDALDANKDGKLVVGEIPPPPRHHGHHGPRGDGPDDPESWDGPPPSPSLAPPGNAPVQPAPTPQPAK